MRPRRDRVEPPPGGRPGAVAAARRGRRARRAGRAAAAPAPAPGKPLRRGRPGLTSRTAATDAKAAGSRAGGAACERTHHSRRLAWLGRLGIFSMAPGGGDGRRRATTRGLACDAVTCILATAVCRGWGGIDRRAGGGAVSREGHPPTGPNLFKEEAGNICHVCNFFHGNIIDRTIYRCQLP